MQVRPRIGDGCHGPCSPTWSSRKSENACAGERAGVAEEAEQPVVAGVEALLRLVYKLAADLQWCGAP